MGTDSDRSLEERLNDLATSETAQLEPRKTISARTLLAPGGLPGSGKASKAPSRPPLSSLPKISLALRSGEASAGNARGRSNADLTLSGVLGSGGMGKVHLARQYSLDREVAVKTLHPSAQEGMADALVSEAVLTGNLAHPGIIPVHALGTDNEGRPVLVMKRIEGVSWEALLADPDLPAWKDWEERAPSRLLVHLEILAEICDAVHFAHSSGIVHRDIKPENVMLGRFGEVYLVDWGVAVHTSNQEPGLAGTPAYMAPEMAAEDPVDERTDVYLLGATLHHVLTGYPPHRGGSLVVALREAFASEPFDYGPDVPSALADLCRRAMSRDPGGRPQTALAFRTCLRDFQRFQSSQAISDASWERLEKLRELLSGAEEAFEGGTLEAHRLAAEAQFGFDRALDEWDDNERAHRGRHECACLQVELHLRKRDAPAVDALLRAMNDAPEDLLARSASLKRELADEAKEEERLRALDRDHDASIGRNSRGAAALLLFVVGAGIGAYAMVQEGSFAAITPAQGLAFLSVAATAVAAGMFVKRKELMSSALNRRGSAIIALTLALMLVDRAIGWALQQPMQRIFITDLLLLAGGAGAIAILSFRWVGYMAGVFAASAITIAAVPEDLAAPVFLAGSLFAFALALFLWRR